MNERTKLNNEQIAALQEVVGGADVFSCHTAKLLRGIEVIAPELIEIGHPMGVYKAIDPHPYFGAIVTRCGVEYLENIQKQNGMNKKQREIITDASSSISVMPCEAIRWAVSATLPICFPGFVKQTNDWTKNCKNATTKSPTNKDASPGTEKGCRGLFYPLTSVTPTATAWGLTAEVSVACVTKHSSSCCTRS